MMRTQSRDPNALPIWARVADALAVLLLAGAAAIAHYGGFRAKVAGVKFLLLDPWRPAVAAAVLILIRHLFVRRHPLPLRPWRALRRIPVTNDLDRFGGPEASVPWAGRAWLRPTVMFFTFWALTLAMTWPQFTSMYSVKDEGDPYFSVWRLAWFAHQLPRDPLHLFDANIFYPERFTFAFSDSMLLPGLIGAPFLWLGMHQLFLANLAVVATFVLSAMAMFNLVRLLTRNDAAAFVAGVVFASIRSGSSTTRIWSC